MSRRLKGRLGSIQDGQGGNPSPVRPPRERSPREQRIHRLNRMLLVGGAGLAFGAVGLELVAPHFNPVRLGIDLGAVALGLLMGKGIGLFMFRRILPTASK